jgi:hypothetical protein
LAGAVKLTAVTISPSFSAVSNRPLKNLSAGISRLLVTMVAPAPASPPDSRRPGRCWRSSRRSCRDGARRVADHGWPDPQIAGQTLRSFSSFATS